MLIFGYAVKTIPAGCRFAAPAGKNAENVIKVSEESIESLAYTVRSETTNNNLHIHIKLIKMSLVI